MHQIRSLTLRNKILLIVSYVVVNSILFKLFTTTPVGITMMNRWHASRIMKLPKEATVVGVIPGEWAGDGTIDFKLPRSSRSSRDWMNKIIVANISPDLKDKIANNPTNNLKWQTYRDGMELSLNRDSLEIEDLSQMQIDYNKKTDIYTFSVVGDK